MDKDEEFLVKIVSHKKDESNCNGFLYLQGNEIKFSITPDIFILEYPLKFSTKDIERLIKIIFQSVREQFVLKQISFEYVKMDPNVFEKARQ